MFALVVCRVAQCIFGASILFYVWKHHTDAVWLWTHIKSFWFRPSSTVDAVSEKQMKFKQRAEEDFQKWRLNMQLNMIKIALIPFSVWIALVVVVLVDANLSLYYIGVISGVLYIICVLVHHGILPSSRTSCDIIFAGVTVLYIARLARDAFDGSPYDSYHINRIYPTLRTATSVAYLDYRRAAIANVFVSVVDIVLNASYAATQTVWYLDATAELFAWTYVLMISYVVQESGRSLVAQRLETKLSTGGWRAVRSILSVLCDAVVHLGCDLTILEECPQLGHLLMSGTGSSHKLDGGNILRYIVDEDKQPFKDFISRQASIAQASVNSSVDQMMSVPVDTGPAALHVSLKDAMGSVFRVEIIHAHLANLDEGGHLLGVRDLGDHEREPAPSSVPQQARSDVPTSSAQRCLTVSSGSIGSDSLSDESGTNLLESSKFHSLSLLLDVFDDKLPIIEATARFQNPDEGSEEASEQMDHALPSLSEWLPSKKLRSFRDWTQTVANALSYGHPPPSFGKVKLKPFGPLLEMTASSVHADTEETDEVRVNFTGTNVRFSNKLLTRTTSLQRINEGTRASWSLAEPVAASVATTYGRSHEQAERASQNVQMQVNL
eukprot:TRINITY_DN2489_c0_g1_i3.p1 TRINITY_DN2489_c0_g1~~TRINITY_DN2489_c0_g1_i3.p1  ORF type:complete len:608 (+),score=59.28 TRINITY_DN2489_c0_g1_i3:138-1961(+)